MPKFAETADVRHPMHTDSDTNLYGKAQGCNMKTMQEMQLLIENLRELYTDVRLLDAETIDKIEEGKRTNPYGEKLCYASECRTRMSKHCAVKAALATRQEQCRLECFDPDIVQVIARYYEIDGKPYVLEMIKRMKGTTTIMDPEDGERLMSEISGYSTKLYHDALTGVFNRRYYEDVARSIVGPAGVAIMDLDDFKVYNDTYGHHAGDLTLEAVCHTVCSCIRQTDTMIRYGGDEFLIILPGITQEFFAVKLEQIRQQVHAATVPGYSHIHPSLSIGGVMLHGNNGMEDTVRRADRLMYQAKERKNFVVMEETGVDSASSGASLAAQAPKKQQILIVDDSELNREILSEILGGDYRILEAANGQEALDAMRDYSGDIALVLLDLNMPVMSGFEVLDHMNRNHAIEDIPVIMISSEDSEESIRRAYEMGASDYVNRPFDFKVVYRRVYNTIKLYAKQRRLVTMVSDQIRKQEKNTTMLVGVLSQIVEFRNGESGLHVQHIRVLTEKILERLLEKGEGGQISPEEKDNIPLASALHDIGKIAIDEKILNKPGRLTQEEFEEMKKHTVYGADMLHKLVNFNEEPLLQTAWQIARSHHERWDGRGYPDGLKGDEIPMSAQIVALADVYDALTSERCYKKAFGHETAIQMILNGECGTFNPVLLECLKDIADTLQMELQKDFQP